MLSAGPTSSLRPGLPDGLFSQQKSQFGYILEGLEMKHVGVFYDTSEYFMAIWYILWPFGIVCGHLVYFSRIGMFRPREIWQPWFHPYVCISPLDDNVLYVL
jgi:hypothetical protein